MDIQPETPWDSAPDVSARIVTAIGRIATVLRAGMKIYLARMPCNFRQASAIMRPRLRDHAAPIQERWQSGRMYLTRNQAYG